jgi:molecular chaperone GrpE (heat shock protein)
MADNNDGKMNINDIGMIRNILMGEQISDFEKRFNALQDQMKDLENQLQDKINHLGEANNSAQSELEKTMDQRFETIEKLILSSIEKLDKRLDKVSKDDKMRLGKMLDRVSKQLMGE